MPKVASKNRRASALGRQPDEPSLPLSLEDLRNSEERFQLVQKATHDAIYDWDLKSDQLFWNENTATIFRYAPESIRTDLAWWAEKIHPDEREAVTKSLHATIADGRNAWESEYRFLRGDGSWCDVLDRGYIVYDSQGKSIRMIGAMADITEKKQSERALKESEQLFRMVADTVPTMIDMTDAQGRFEFFNKAFLDFTGYAADDLIGLGPGVPGWEKQFPPGGYSRWLGDYMLRLSKGEPFMYEVQLRHRSGEFRWTVVYGVPRYDYQGNVAGYTEAYTDISRLKESERALKESETRFRSMAEASPLLIWLIDPHERLSYCNKALLDFAGITREGLQGLSFSPFIHPDDLPELLRIRLNAIQTNSGYTYECRILRRDGVYRWILIGAAPRFIGDGQYEGFVGSGVDITERKLAEQALIESEKRFRSMADSAPFMIMLSDFAAECFYFNKAWMRFTGTDDKMSSGHGWFRAVHPDDRSECLHRYKTAINAAEEFECEFRVRRHDGVYRWVFCVAGPRYDAQGKLLGFVGSLMDITERKQYGEELERMVAERTSALQSVNHELEAFSYSVSHDLRAPLRGIDGISQLLYKKYNEVLDEQGKTYLQMLRQEAQRMSELINEMLNLSRLTRGTMHWETVNLSRIAKTVAAALRQQAPERNVRFDIQPDVIVSGDANLLQAVMENLLGNAWKFTSGHETAHIQFGCMEQERQKVYYVKDDGAGFEMEYAENLFSPFQRLHDASEFPGTGIGLATVQRIIHRHGGKVWAYGAVEEGAQFYFTLGEKHG